MVTTKRMCICTSADKPQRHHLFRKGLRKEWMTLGLKNISLYWSRGVEGKGAIVNIEIPINAYVKLCPRCHKLTHPENLSYHLNALVVKHLGK